MKRMVTSTRCLPPALLAATLLVLPGAARADGPRLVLPPGETSNMPQKDITGGGGGFSVNYVPNAADLVRCLLGSGVLFQNATLNGAPLAAGTFSGGGPILGFDSGIILSSGDIASIVGPNVLDDVTTDNGRPGDADLDAIVGGDTFDATVLEFDFECETENEFSFQYVFTSDEYNEYVNDIYNDAFAFFLNGTAVADNIALVPNYCQTPGGPVAINGVNCNNPYAPPTGVNCGCYRNNDLTDAGGAINTEMDGLTVTFVASATLNPGLNHIKLVIADRGDPILDSNVLIRCQSFACVVVPTEKSSWGSIKSRISE